MAERVIKCAECGKSQTVDGRCKKRTLCDACLKRKRKKNLDISKKSQGMYNHLPLPQGHKRCGYCGIPIKITESDEEFKTTFCTNSCVQAALAVLHFKYRTKPTPMTPQRREWLENMGVRVT